MASENAEMEVEENNESQLSHSKKSLKKSRKSSKTKRDKDRTKSSKSKSDKSKKKASNKDKKRKRKRSKSRSRSRSRSRDKRKKRRRSRDRSSSSHSRHRYSSHYSRSPSPYRSHRRYRRRDRARRYKRSRHYHSSSSRSPSRSYTRSRSRSRSSSRSSTTSDKQPTSSNANDPNGSKLAEIKATAPNAMQQLNNGAQVANPLAAFNSVFGNLNRPAALALNNPYKLNTGVSGTPLLMSKMAMELRKSAVEEQTKSAAAKVAEAKNKNDESLFFTVHLPGMNLTAIGGINPQITRPARRLYVGNLPVGMGLTEQILTEFFSQCCKGLGIGTHNPVLSVWLNSEQTFGFIEFRSVQDTNLALQLFDSLQLGGRQLRFGRPVDYKEPPDNLKNYIVGENGENGTTNTDSNARNIEKGSPAAMLLMQQQQQQTDILNGQEQEKAKQSLELADKQTTMTDEKESNVLLLMNMLNEEDIGNDEEYEDIKDDIECECENYGNLVEVAIPRIGEIGCGRVFLKYENIAQAKKCKSKVDGRQFSDNTVQCVYFKEELFNNKQYGHDHEVNV
eukprot:347740_1